MIQTTTIMMSQMMKTQTVETISAANRLNKVMKLFRSWIAGKFLRLKKSRIIFNIFKDMKNMNHRSNSKKIMMNNTNPNVSKLKIIMKFMMIKIHLQTYVCNFRMYMMGRIDRVNLIALKMWRIKCTISMEILLVEFSCVVGGLVAQYRLSTRENMAHIFHKFEIDIEYTSLTQYYISRGLIFWIKKGFCCFQGTETYS